MKIIYLLFVNTFAGNRDQCHPIWLCNQGSTTVVANLSFQRFLFFSNTRARTNDVKIVSIVNNKRKNSIRERNNPILH